MSSSSSSAAAAAQVVTALRASLEAKTSAGAQNALDLLRLTSAFLRCAPGEEARALAALRTRVPVGAGAGAGADEDEAAVQALRVQMASTPLLVRQTQSLMLAHADALMPLPGWTDVARAWFVPSARAPELGVWALRVLSQATAGPAVLPIASLFAREFDLGSLLTGLEPSRSPRQRAEWEDAIALLTAFPARMANVAQGVPASLETREFYARLTTRWESLLAPGRGSELAPLLVRFLKLGWARDAEGWWPTLFPLLLRRWDGKWEPDYLQAWRHVCAALGPYRADLVQSLLNWVDQRPRSPDPAVDLAQGDADVRLAHILLLVLGPPPANKPNSDPDVDADSDADSGADAEETGDEDLAYLFPPAGWSSPALARALVIWTSFSPGPTTVGDMLHQALAHWGDRNVRLASSLEQHLSRGSMLILTLSRLLSLSSDPAWRGDVLAILQRERGSKVFLDGVGGYLDHPSPVVRRIGLVSAQILVHSLVQLDPSSVTLDLGVCEGEGAGQELARALSDLRWVDQPVHQGGAIGFFPARDDGEEGQPTEVAHHLAELSPNPRPPPKQRRLGTGRHKPLIQMIEPEEGEAFSKLVPSSESEGEDSSDDNASDGDGISLGLGSRGAGEAAMKERSTEFTHSEAAEKRDHLSSRMPKPRRKAVVYIHELPPLLRGKRGDVRVALHALPSLVRAKRGWGSEVQDSALELFHALIQLDDHSITDFDRWLATGLVALLVSSDATVVQAAAELLFSPHLSVARKNVLLSAFVYAALELEGTFPPLTEPGKEDLTNQVSKHVHALVQRALQRAKNEGEAHVPALRRQTSLLARPTPTSLAAHRAGIRPAPPPSWSERGSDFLAPLLTRTLAHLTLRGGYFTRSGPPWPMATLPPLLLPSILEAIAALAYALPSLRTTSLEVALAVSNAAYVLSAERAHALRLAANEVFLLSLSGSEAADLLGGISREADLLFSSPDPAGTAIAAAVQLRIAEFTQAWKEKHSLLALE